MVDIKPPERAEPSVETPARTPEPTQTMVPREEQLILEQIINQAMAASPSQEPEASREGLFQILSLSKSRVHSRILAERRGAKGKKEANELARGRRKGAKIESQIRVQAEQKVNEGTTPQEKCLGIDTLLTLDKRSLAELKGDAQVLREDIIPHEKGDAKKRFEQELKKVERDIVKTEESIQQRETQRKEAAEGAEIPNEVADFIQKVVGPLIPPEKLAEKIDQFRENPLGTLEEILSENASNPRGREVITELVKDNVSEENVEKEVKIFLNPVDRKKIGLMVLLFLLGIQGAVMFNAFKGSKQGQQMT